jgi:hypothetical protein
MRKSKSSPGVTFDTVRELALELPGVVEVSSYGTPGFKVKGKLFLRFHQNGESLVVAADFADRDALILEQPDRFYITDHYLNYPWVLVRLSAIGNDQLPGLLKQAWRFRASRQKSAR